MSPIAPGDDLPPLRRIVTREDVKAYAEASGDRNPLHQDGAVARAAGFPGVIAHGMFTMGHLATCLATWAGDSTAVAQLSASFRAPVFMGEEIEAGGRVVAIEDGIATLDVWVTVTRDGRVEWPIKRGQARVRI